MKDFNSVLQRIRHAKERRESGNWNSLLFPFERMSRMYPGFVRGHYYIITALPGVGKTKIGKFLSVLQPVLFGLDNNIPVKVLYFALEESEEEFSVSMVSLLLKQVYNFSISPAELNSFGNSALSDAHLAMIEDCTDMYNQLREHITVIDSVSHPTGIYMTVKEHAANTGTIHENTVTFGGEQHQIITGYTPNDPEQYTFVVTDHISLMRKEQGMTQYESIGYYSSQYCLKGFCKTFNFITVNLQQQTADKDKKAFNFRGHSIDEKLEVSLDGLANNKETARDADTVLGLFAPSRYDIREYRGYNIEKFADKIRFMKVLKDRHFGQVNKRLALYFDGACGYFNEMPPATQLTGREDEYLASMQPTLVENHQITE